MARGIFWIIDDIEEPKIIAKKIPVDFKGNIINPDTLALNSKKMDNYNHKLTWSSFDIKITSDKAFDYYPRGRVEIRNGKATIYANPNICINEIIDRIIKEFDLDETNGIVNVRCIPDYSEHYKCHLDR